MVETRTRGETWYCGRDKDQRGDLVLWLRLGPVGETMSCGRDKDQWGDMVLW